MIEVVVIGGGIIGSATALALQEVGAAVNLVDAERPGAAATAASAGMLAPQYESPGPGPILELGLAARAQYDAFAATIRELAGTDLHLRRDGMLVANLTDDERAKAEDDVRWQHDMGLNAEVVDAGEAARIQPGVSPDVGSWLWLPDEGQVDTQLLVDALPAALAATDVRVLSGVRVERVLERQGAVTGVALADGRTLDADAVVLAAGAWSDTIQGLPRTVPVTPVRGQMLRFAPGTVDLQCLVSTHAGRYIVPRHDGSVLAGSTMEEVGYDRTVTDDGARAIGATAATLVPGLDGARPMEHWADVRPLTEDGMPILGPDPELGGLVYATGHGRNGILLGPISGRITAAAVLGEAPPYPWEPFGIARFT